MNLNSIGLIGSISEELVTLKYPFIAITPKPTQLESHLLVK